MSRHLGRTAACLLVLAACAAPPAPAPLSPPPLRTEVDYYFGSALSGPLPQRRISAVTAGNALLVRVRLLYLERMPAGVLAPLAGSARLVAAARGGTLLQAAALRAAGARIGAADEARRLLRDLASSESTRSAPVAVFEGALPDGVTTVFEAASPQGDRSQAALRVLASREDGADGTVLTAAFGITAATDSRRELVVLQDQPVIGGGPLAILLPSPFAGDPGAALAAFVEVEPTPIDADGAASFAVLVERCAARLEAARATAEARASPLPASEARLVELTEAFRAVGSTPENRAALLFVADLTGAPLATDLALGADDRMLAEWVARVAAETLPTADAPAVGWLLERTGYALLAAALRDELLAPELQGILLRHTGEVGRLAPALDFVLARCPDGATLAARLADENRAFLGDSHPAARVRAFDWLAARGLAPAGFDPLAPARERRAALARAEAEAEASR